MTDKNKNKKDTIGVINPHDKLFREVYSDWKSAHSFLINHLPSKVLDLVDMSTLEISKDSFIEKDLAEYYSDILYQVTLSDGSAGSIYLLFEHKSYHDKYVHLQLLEYMVKIWRLHIKQQKDEPTNSPISLPIVIPLLICHGRQEWPEGTMRLTSMLSGPVDELVGYIPDFGFELYDLNRYSEDQIKGTVMLQAMMLLFKYGLKPEFRHRLPEIFSMIATLLEKETGMQYIETVLRYVVSVVGENEGLSLDEIKEMAEQAISKNMGGYIMTIAEKLRQEGELRGELKGVREGIELGIALKFPEHIDAVMSEVNKIDDLEKLTISRDAIKTAKDVSEILALLK